MVTDEKVKEKKRKHKEEEERDDEEGDEEVRLTFMNIHAVKLNKFSWFVFASNSVNVKCFPSLF